MEPVRIGESFSVQYVLEDIEKNDGFTAPFFKDFRLVSGPTVYGGTGYNADGSRPLKNIVFTLVPIKKGRFIIPGATANVNGKFIKSDDVVVEVITKTESLERALKRGSDESPSEYFLRPGEDPYEKMKKNLFMKVMVDKKNCYVGEPVVATFKLYSRLESRSDIVKNPGFYGFAVQDMVSLNDKMTSTETVNGKSFDVHTVRKVQLYPLQAGQFAIDAMEVLNKVEFSKSIINKKTEQEIVEGVFENDDHNSNENTITYENSLSTENIVINVKPYPTRNKPAAFNGATGNFLIRAELEKNDLARNEEGDLLVTIEGNGNFTQLVPPPIQWPGGIESFDPTIKDDLDKTHSPLKGSRTFRFPFVVNKAGVYTLPPISLALFDPDSNSYKTVFTSPVEIKISNKGNNVAEAVQITNNKKNKWRFVWWAGGLLLILTAAVIWIITKKRLVAEAGIAHKHAPRIEELLLPASFALKANDDQFYKLLQKSIWDHLGNRLKLSGSGMNKADLYKAMREKNLPEDQCRDILNVLHQCEAAVFTKAAFPDHKEELLKRTRTILALIKIG